jgi:hypothetical protein
MKMKKIIIGICIATTLTVFGCQNSIVEKPKKEISEDVMVDILYDLSLLEAIKTQNISNSDNTINASKYIYKKYKIDSVQFAQNNKYFASDVERYKKMFERVKLRLDRENENVEKIMKKKGEKVLSNVTSSKFNPDEPQIK